MTVTGIVKLITYKNEENGYSIFHLATNDGKSIKCAGTLDMITEGDCLECSGNIKNDKKWGDQLICDNIKRAVPEGDEAIRQYLMNKVTGIGKAIAENIVKEFGKDSIETLKEHPLRVAKKVPKLSKEKALSASSQLIAIENEYESDMFFTKAGISATMALKILKSFDGMSKKEAYETILDNPYILIDKVKGIGFLKADEIGKNLEIPKNSLMRITHGIEYFLDNKSVMEGHTYYPYDLFFTETSEMLGVTTIDLKKGVDRLYTDKKVIITDSNRIYLSKFHYIENKTAMKLCLLKNNAKQFSFNNIESEIINIEEKLNISLDETQRRAVKTAINEGICVITGGPGTGKTTTLRVFIEYLKEKNISFALAAPTGRAAKRMSEATRENAQTIHRLIGIPQNEQEIDKDVIIIDEGSMVDIDLMYTLTKNIKIGSHLIIVGDIDQLPSVGAGNVLKDIIESKIIPTTKLENIHRQSKESHIVTFAHRINKKLPIDLDKKFEDFFLLKEEDPEAVVKGIEYLSKVALPNHFKISPDDVQILCPVKTGELGTNNLNKRMQDIFNPLNPQNTELELGSLKFRVGDRVMNTKNNYNQKWIMDGKEGYGIFNGDTGIITAINNKAPVFIDVKFYDGKEARFEYDEITEQLTLSYAITIHKSQGSEYQVVIIPVLKGGAPMLFNKFLLYTAITRASKCVVLYGNAKVIYAMQFNDKASIRYTSLSDMIQAVAT